MQSTTGANAGGGAVTAETAGALGMLPLSAFRYVERTREPLLVEDVTRDDRFARDPYFAGAAQWSLLVVPVQSQGALQAVVLLENRLRSNAFSSERLDGVLLIAGQLAVSLRNAMLYSSLERKVAERTAALNDANDRLELISITDSLTGLPNRRRMDQVLAAEWQRALGDASSIGLAMIDIDEFKRYNDQYGHVRGDGALRRIAGALQTAVRHDRDFVARYGGEEFLMLLPDTDLASACVVAERARRAVADLREPHVKTETGIMTISVGITAFVASADASVEHYLEVADAALYEAKRKGRNQVTTR